MNTMTPVQADRFIEMILADQDLVDAEFTALIDANGLGLPPSTPSGTADDGNDDRDQHSPRRPASTRLHPHGVHPAIRARSGERAPPTPTMPFAPQPGEVKPLANQS